MKIFWIVLVVCFASAFSANADDIIHGKRGDWNTHWFGISADDASQLSGAGTIVAQAIEASEEKNASLFYSFWDIDSNSPPAQIKAWYGEWNSYSQRYVYIIAQEAVIGNGDLYSAISIAPAALRQKAPGEIIINEPQFRAQVIFARKMAGIWKLLPNSFDDQLEQALLSRASTILYQPQKNFTAEGIAEQDKKFHNDFLELMKKNGATPESINSQKEIYEVEQSGAKLNHWVDWTNYFKTVILNPPVVFEKRDEYPYNFEDPSSAFRFKSG